MPETLSEGTRIWRTKLGYNWNNKDHFTGPFLRKRNATSYLGALEDGRVQYSEPNWVTYYEDETAPTPIEKYLRFQKKIEDKCQPDFTDEGFSFDFGPEGRIIIQAPNIRAAMKLLDTIRYS